ncbi:reverse transcriptase domain-containing protein [Tanacetum coccineum]
MNVCGGGRYGQKGGIEVVRRVGNVVRGMTMDLYILVVSLLESSSMDVVRVSDKARVVVSVVGMWLLASSGDVSLDKMSMMLVLVIFLSGVLVEEEALESIFGGIGSCVLSIQKMTIKEIRGESVMEWKTKETTKEGIVIKIPEKFHGYKLTTKEEVEENEGQNRNPKEFDGKGGAIALTRWIEKMESVFDNSGCTANQRVWALLAEEFYPSNKMEKLENDFWNHTMVGANYVAYTDRFHELAKLVPHLSAILTAGILTDEAVRCGTLTKGSDKRKEMEESIPPRNDNVSTYPKCAKCYTFHPENAPLEALQDPKVVTGTFSLNNQFATVLFDSGADFSFIYTKFAPLLNVEPSIVNPGYAIEIADGKIVEVDRHAFWSLNEDILKITILKTNTPYPSMKIRRIRACTNQRPLRNKDQYAVFKIWNQYNILEDIKHGPYSKKSPIRRYASGLTSKLDIANGLLIVLTSRRGKVYSWETATYGKIWDNEDVHDIRSVETEFPAIVFNEMLTSEAALSCDPTASSLNNDEIDFRISFDESDDEDCKPTVSYFNDLDYFNDFENEFPAIVYNDALTSKSNFLTEPTLSPQHINEFDLKSETSLSECDEVKQNVLYFNDLFPYNVVYPNDLKSNKDNDDDKIDIENSLGYMSVKPLLDLINNDVVRLEICTLQLEMYISSQSSCDFTTITINGESEEQKATEEITRNYYDREDGETTLRFEE